MTKKDSARFYDHPVFGPVKSVTTILKETLPKPALLPWAVKVGVEHLITKAGEQATHIQGEKMCHLKYLQGWADESKKAWRNVGSQAAGIGTEVHNAIEHFLAHGEYPLIVTSTARVALTEFEKWSLDVGLVPTQVEILVHGKIPYAGRCDFVGMFMGKEYLIDWKSSKSCYLPDYPLQLAAYAVPLGIKNIGCVRLDKVDGRLYWHDFSSILDSSYEFFSKLVEVCVIKDEFAKLTKGMGK